MIPLLLAALLSLGKFIISSKPSVSLSVKPGTRTVLTSLGSRETSEAAFWQMSVLCD